jgi:valyl-tRNA synthetase
MTTEADTPRAAEAAAAGPEPVSRDYAPYDPSAVESGWYEEWLREGLFKPRSAGGKPRPADGKRPFVVTMPPPNVTGELHLGHAMFVTLEDILVRWHRMLGEPTLWVPGRDHASIAAHVVLERQLAAEGTDRHALGREAFLDRMWEWMDTYGKRIRFQLYRLGASADWDRERFTMDPGPSRAVRTAFVRLYERGLIYRGNRITNWCPDCMTALSDLEVDHVEVEGQLSYVRYPLVPRGDGGETAPATEYIEIATTRPETILADTAVAVNPEDARYSALIGRRAIVPHVGRQVPIVADEAVDPAFGTGAVKVTPGHDPTDFEIGQRHNLPTVLVMNLDGTMNAEAGAYQGMPTLDARRAFLRELEAEGLLLKTVPHRHAVGHCQRSGTVVEPMVTEQWYVRIKPLAEPALEAVRDGRIRFVPERFAKIYYNWMENIRDWCISRQLWWGHRIPVWYRSDGGPPIVSVEDPDPADYPGIELTQDPDILDTWFSSGLWPFSTLGWPDDTEDLRTFYPTTVMETGYDIIFFWVARMIMQGLALTGDVPFREVYLHGMVRVDGQKMSKVKGNVKDPLDLMERYGTDALRLGLVIGTTPGNDISISEPKFEAQRNFVNKLWNAGRFILANMPEYRVTSSESREEDDTRDSLSLADRWIRSRAEHVTAEASRLLEEFQFGEAARLIQDFLWEDFCDWYLEVAKIQLREATSDEQRRATRRTLVDVFERVLLLLHPFAPFVTEELWQSFAPDGQEESRDGSRFRRTSIMISSWPTAGSGDPAAEDSFGALIDLIQGIRRLKTDYRVGAQLTPAVLDAGGGEQAALLRDHASVIRTLARLDPLRVADHLDESPERALSVVEGGVQAFLPVEGLFDVAQETARLQREVAEAGRQVERTTAQLAQRSFTEKAPPQVVAQRREQLAEQEGRLARLRARLETLEGLGA